MNTNHYFTKFSEHENEKASNVYIMSLIGIVAGLPLPIVNLICTLVFYFTNRKSTYFIRWNCTQALISQFFLFIINNTGFWWTLSILFGGNVITNEYIAYLIFLLVINVFEFIATIYTAVKVRKGHFISWFFFGQLSSLILNKKI